MKKRYLLLASLMVVPTLASCAKDKPTGPIEGGSFIENNDNLVKPNLPEKEDYEEHKVDKLPDLVECGSLDLEKYDFYEEGSEEIILVKDKKTGYIGFYNRITNQMIIECQYNSNYFANRDYNILTSSYVTLIEINYDDEQMVYDNLGNLIWGVDNIHDYMMDADFRHEHDHLGLPFYNTSRLESKLINKKVYFKYSYLDYSKIYGYDENGALEKLAKYPAKEEEEDLEIEKPDKPSYSVGNLFDEANKLDLKDFGFPGKHLQITPTGYVSYYEGTTLKASYYANLENAFIVNSSFIIQEAIELPEDSYSYDLTIDGRKYSLATSKINIFTGEKEEIKFGYIIEDAFPFKNAQGVFTYALAKVHKINEYMALEEEREYVMDENLNFLKDYTSQRLGSFIRFGNNYYNEDTGLLIDNSGNIITHLSGLNSVEFFYNKNLIKARYEGKYGLLDENGRVVEEFKYDEINIDDDRNLYYLRSKNDFFIRGSESEDILNGYDNLSNEGVVSYVYNDDKLVIYTDDKIIDVKSYSDISSVIYNNIEKANVGILHQFRVEHLDSNNKYEILAYNTLAGNKMNTVGEAKTGVAPDGHSLKNAVMLKAGENNVHNPVHGSNEQYYAFEVKNPGYYSINAYGDIYSRSDALLYDEVVNGEKVTETIPYRQGHYIMLAPRTYYFVADINNPESTIEIEEYASKKFTEASENVVHYQVRDVLTTNDNKYRIYSIDTDAEVDKLYTYNDETKEFTNVVVDKEHMNGEDLYRLKPETHYFFIFDKPIIENPDYNENLEPSNPNSHENIYPEYKLGNISNYSFPGYNAQADTNLKGLNIRSFTPSYSDNYRLESPRDTSTSIAIYDEETNDFVQVHMNSFEGKSYYYLTEGVEYFISYQGDYNDTTYSIKPLENMSALYQEEDESFISNVMKTYKPSSDDLYEFKTTGTASVYYFSGNRLNKLSSSNNCYPLKADTSYYISYKPATKRDTLKKPARVTEDFNKEAETLDKKVIKRYSPIETGIYELTTTSSDYTVYSYDNYVKNSVYNYNKANEYLLIKGNVYYFEYNKGSEPFVVNEPKLMDYSYKETAETLTENTIKVFKVENSGAYKIDAGISNSVRVNVINPNTKNIKALDTIGANDVYALLKGETYIIKYTINNEVAINAPVEVSNSFPSIAGYGENEVNIFKITPEEDATYGFEFNPNTVKYFNTLTYIYENVEFNKNNNYLYSLNKGVTYFFIYNSSTMIKEPTVLKNVKYEVNNDSIRPWKIAQTENGTKYTSINHYNSSKSTIEFKAKETGIFNINYRVSSENTCDTFTINIKRSNGRVENCISKISGVVEDSIQIYVEAGDTLICYYEKDGSNSRYDDSASIEIMK